MTARRHIAASLFALTALAWHSSSWADLPCFTPGPPAQTYPVQASTHPWDDAIGTGKRVHAYRFTVPQAKKLCSIGYEAPSPAPTTYKFQLFNCNSGVPVPIPGASTTVPGAFFSPGLQYHILPGSWVLLPGNCYEIHRKVIGPSTAAQRMGRRLDNETTYPITAVPSITILGTDFFNTPSGPHIIDAALPLIEFGTR